MGTKKGSEDVDTAEAVREEAAATPPAPATPATRTIEEWAEAKGMLPQFGPESKMGARLNPAYWKFAATRGLMAWQEGQQVAEQEFDAAVEKMLGVRHGG